MKTRGGRFLLILGAGLAVMAFVVLYIVMSKSSANNPQSASVPTQVPLRTVAVVNQDIPAYTTLNASNVATADIDASTALSNTTGEPSAIYGKMTLVPLTKGQQIETTQLTTTGFSDVLAKGEKAFTLAVPERSTFGNSIAANDRIDVLWTASIEYYQKVPKADGKFDYEKQVYTTTKTLLQDIQVVRVIDLSLPAPPSSGGGVSGQINQASGQAPADSTAYNAANPASLYVPDAPYQAALVLGVTDQQAEVLKYARENGTLDFTLRSSALQKNPDGSVVKDAQGQEIRGDQDVEKTTGVSIDQLIKEYGLLPPVVAP